MAQNEENLLLRGTSGTIAKMITYRQRAGKTIISKKRGKSSVPATETQLNVQDRFKKAVAWAKGAIKDPVVTAMYRAKAAPNQSAFNAATADAYNPPLVESIQTDGYHTVLWDTITVKATNRGHSESFLPARETRLLTMQICGCAERKFACLKTDWERFIPFNIFFEENGSSADPASSSFLLFSPETKTALFSVPLGDSLLIPCCFPAERLLPTATNQQAGSRKVARK